MALGAAASAVRWLVMSQGAKAVLVGLVLGVGAALASTRLLSTLLFNVKAVDPLVFAGVSLVMTTIGMLASYMPARRASQVVVNLLETLHVLTAIATPAPPGRD